MTKFLVCIFLCIPIIYGQVGQVTNPLGGVAESYRRAIELRNQIEAQRARSELERAQADAIRQETDNARNRQNLDLAEIAFTARMQREFVPALLSVKARYPDFEVYRVEVARLMTKFWIAKTNDAKLEDYIEGIYLIAKYASFSQVVIANTALGAGATETIPPTTTPGKKAP